MSIFGVPYSLAIAIGVPEVLGSLVGQSTAKSVTTWFATLRKPSWEPPGPLFGIAWTVLYGFMGYASWRVWLQGGWQAQQRALTLYVIQLVLNLSWPLVFFNAKRLGRALALNLTVLAFAALTTAEFFKVDAFAGKLMLPYVAWLAFANALNYSVMKKNPNALSAVEDLSHKDGFSNPGERNYNKPATASWAGYVNTGSHSRLRTVSIRCQAAQASSRSIPKRLSAMRAAAVRSVATPCQPFRPVRHSLCTLRASAPSTPSSLLRGA